MPGVIDQDINFSVPIHHLLSGRFQSRKVSHAQIGKFSRKALLAQFMGCFFACIQPIPENDAGTFLRKKQGRGLADAAGSTRDDGYFVL